MCITVPMRIIGIEGLSASCEVRDIRREVRLDLLDFDVAVGDYVLIHGGHALQVITEADSLATWRLFDEITSMLDHADASTQGQGFFADLAKATTR
jgi:hydrogenase expression/formation protein HypC